MAKLFDVTFWENFQGGALSKSGKKARPVKLFEKNYLCMMKKQTSLTYEKH
jgi:hypothetical protein